MEEVMLVEGAGNRTSWYRENTNFDLSLAIILGKSRVS
jgi:hypothetical protein